MHRTCRTAIQKPQFAGADLLFVPYVPDERLVCRMLYRV